jgi:hypothetical protein
MTTGRPCRCCARLSYCEGIAQEVGVCYLCSIELDAGSGRMSFPGNDLTAKAYCLRLHMLTGRRWEWHRERKHPRLFFLTEEPFGSAERMED